MFSTTTTLLSRRAEPSPLWFETFPKGRIRRGKTRISRIRYGKTMRVCALRVPPFVRRNRAPHERAAGGESDPGFSPLVRRTGEFKWRGRLIYLSTVLAKEPVGLLPCDNDRWEIRYSFHPLGLLNQSTQKIIPAEQWHQRE